VSLPVVILAGGLATRLRPLTAQAPKILIDVGGRPFAERQIDLMRRQGIHEVIYCVGYLGETVESTLGDGTRWGMRFRYAYDGPALLGTGGAVVGALPLAGPEFFVMYGDSYLDCDFGSIERAFRASGAPALMVVFKNDDRFDRSNVEFADGRIVRYDKVQRNERMHHIDYGLGILTAKALRPWQSREQAFDLANVYRDLATNGELAGIEVHQRFYEIGSTEGLEETRALFAAGGDAT